MIPLSAHLIVKRLPLASVVITPHEPFTLNLDHINHYCRLLRDQPESDTDPIIVRPFGVIYAIENGRHRFLAHHIVGRLFITSLIVQE